MSTTSIQEPSIRSRVKAAAPTAPRPSLVRVLHVINGEDYAGAERVQDHLALRLPEQGFEVGFACLKPRRFAEMRCAVDAPLYELPMRSKLDASPIRRLARLLCDEGYALVHTHTPRTALVGGLAARLARLPLIHHVHCQTAVEVGSRRWQDKVNLVLERWTTHRATSIIAVSPSLYRYLLRHGYSRQKLRLVPNGVPSNRAGNKAVVPAFVAGLMDDGAKVVAAQGQGLPEYPAQGRGLPKAWTIGVLALFRPRKGLEVLLDALALVRERGHDVSLRAVGRFQSPGYEQEIQRRAVRLGLESAIRWVGFRQNIEAELARMDMLALPSLVSEAMPMSILEAMAAGVLVIGSRVDGITDLVNDGVDGLLAEPGDADHWASVLERVATGDIDRRPLVRCALEKQRELFSDRSMAAAIAEIYRQVLGQ